MIKSHGQPKEVVKIALTEIIGLAENTYHWNIGIRNWDEIQEKLVKPEIPIVFGTYFPSL